MLLIYLDPHVCQESINLEQEDPATSIEIVEDQQVACDIISDSDESPTTSTNKKNDDSADDSLVHTRSQSSEESYALSSTSSASGSKSVDDEFDDSSFHCPYLLHMDFTTLDPSLALAFICICEEDYNDLVLRLKPVLSSSNPPLFEILEERPKGWPKFVPYVVDGNALNDTLKEFDDFGDPTFDSDDNFEILE
uniref:Cysteine protease n=1 Tax=Acrobeloides nanus TaxID=290746 RepID=A0A914EHR8_9BILA